MSNLSMDGRAPMDPSEIAFSDLGVTYERIMERYRLDVPGTRSPHSPLMLAQEMVGNDQWRHLVTPHLMIRTRRYKSHASLWMLLKLYPTPEAAHAAGPNGISSVIARAHAGLENRKAQSIWALTDIWLKLGKPTLRRWEGLPDLPDCGRYVWDSFRIFALDDLWCSPLDWELRAYVMWRLRTHSVIEP